MVLGYAVSLFSVVGDSAAGGARESSVKLQAKVRKS